MRKAQVEDGIVTNIIAVDVNNVPDWCTNWPTANENTEIGGTYVAGVFSRPTSVPATVPTPSSISFAQLLIGLVTEEWINEVEGEAWLSGTLPEAVLLVIDSLPIEQRFAAKAKALRPSEVLRNDPLVSAMGVASGKTDEDIDAFFRTYSTV